MIEIRNLHFSYPHGGEVFGGLDFALQEGGRVGLVGPTGSGKSTLLHLIMGLLSPHGGEVVIFGEPRRKERDFLEVRRKIGLLFQDSDDQLFCPTVEEDIAFGPLNLGHGHAEAREIVRECTGALGITGLEKDVTHRLSGGEKRLVSLATVLAMRPVCYLLDEPTSGLDEGHSEMLLRFLKERAKTYVISSHDREFLKEATDRVIEIQTLKTRR